MTKQNPDKICDECRKFDHLMNRDDFVYNDVFMQCRCCEDCIKLTNDCLEANFLRLRRAMCIPCYEASKEHVVYMNTQGLEDHTLEDFKIAQVKGFDFPTLREAQRKQEKNE